MNLIKVVKENLLSYKDQSAKLDGNWYLTSISVFTHQTTVEKISTDRTIKYLQSILDEYGSSTIDAEETGKLGDYWVRQFVAEKLRVRFDVSPGHAMDREMRIQVATNLFKIFYPFASEPVKDAIKELQIWF
jgi:hypothetical protein